MFIEQWEKDKYSGIKPGDYDYIWFDFSNMARALILKQDNQFKLYTQESDERTGNWENLSGVSVYDSLEAVKKALFYECDFYCEENAELDKYGDGITNPAIPVIAITTTTAGDINFALTAASPTTSPPIIETVAPIDFGSLKLASNKISNASNIPNTSNTVGKGTPLLLFIIENNRLVGIIS
jgi:hypothetical protein